MNNLRCKRHGENSVMQSFKLFRRSAFSCFLACVLIFTLFLPASAFALSDSAFNSGSGLALTSTYRDIGDGIVPGDPGEGEGGGSEEPGGTSPGEAPGGGSGGGSGEAPGGGSGEAPGGGSGGGSGDPSHEVIHLQLDAFTTDAFEGWIEKLKRSLEGSEYRLSNGIKEKGGKVRLSVGATWSDGRLYYQHESDWVNPGGSITWHSSDPSVATVNVTGVVTAVGDGEVVITATAPNGTKGYMRIAVIGQDGAYVTSAVIVDESGEAYGTSYIDITNLEQGEYQFYLRLTYSDGTTESNAPLAFDSVGSFKVGTHSWSISSEDVGHVNAVSGYFIPLTDGRAKVIVEVTGGDSSIKEGRVTTWVFVNVNTGKYPGGNMPSDSLTIKVVYEEKKELVGKELTFSIAQLKGIQSAQSTYTLTRSGDKYVTDNAEGIYLATLLSAAGIVQNEVAAYRFAANDGANPGTFTNDFLFGYTRYYYPYADWGSESGREVVLPMLAYADSWKEGGSIEKDYSMLNAGTCLRLLFGSTSLEDNSTSKSIKFIHTMTIELKGAPSAGWGDQGDSDKEGERTHDGGIAGIDSGGFEPGGSFGAGYDVDIPANSTLSMVGASSTDSGESIQASESRGSQWQVFEMMSKAESEVDPLSFPNPLKPYIAPLAVSVVVMGACASGVRFRRRLTGIFGEMQAAT